MVEECLGTRIARLHRQISRRFDAELRQFGLTLPQFEVLSELVVFGAPARPSDIAGWLDLERSTVSRNLDVLVQRGFLQVAETSATGRTTRVALTEAGYGAVAEAGPAWSGAQAWINDAFGAGSIDVLDQWLAALDRDKPRP
jgi:DNA-binding MarR family transcriptional regulator